MRVPYKSALGVVGLAAVALALVYWRFADQPASAPAAASPVPVVTAQVQRHDEPIVLSGLGTVQALNTASIQSQVTGVLEEVDFVEGQTVKKGDVLAKIDPRLFEAALAQAQGQLAKDTALHAQAQSDLARFQKLGKEDSIALQQVADQQFLVAQDAAAMEADRGLIASDQAQLDYTILRAPFDGVTGLLQIQIGNLIQPSNTMGIVVLTQVQPIAVVFILPQADIAPVQTAMAKGPVQATVYDQSGAEQLDVGTLLSINNQAMPTSGTVQLKAIFQNQQRQLWPGTFVNVDLTTSVVPNALTIPTNALQQNDKGQYVYVVGADKRVSVRPVEVAQRLHAVALISKGLQAGETVVVQGQYRLTPGTLVVATAPSDAPSPSTASAGMLP
ncbi:MAG TPA: efflux RND transporter periplasmic adaptor subunit [Planctomycetaceae bacterium]|jgi:multidrug efflux system membrane fusion protein|nr:efflux RND transporter periplasmic adaptor subunit [Planctomycetaceae bacterium]